MSFYFNLLGGGIEISSCAIYFWGQWNIFNMKIWTGQTVCVCQGLDRPAAAFPMKLWFCECILGTEEQLRGGGLAAGQSAEEGDSLPNTKQVEWLAANLGQEMWRAKSQDNSCVTPQLRMQQHPHHPWQVNLLIDKWIKPSREQSSCLCVSCQWSKS